MRNENPIIECLAQALSMSDDRADALDFRKGAGFIPIQVTDCRRKGGRVRFVTECAVSKCCWYWEFETPWEQVEGERGDQRTLYERRARIYHYDRNDEGWVRHESGNGIPRCPECGNDVISGGSYDASGRRIERQ